MLSRDVDLCGLALGSAGGLVDHDLSIGAVSYTHLDVYKRQPKDREAILTLEWVE